ncbi:family 78 glycoside hydrolase catalytic domain [Nocardia sp. NPDC052566]|uniref:family 78 glycoside hydrolase catalytic domain n=1 Tax=Nocardia sp. NPDC052566 TaxID=3364330 RepID=UPI0037CC9620
MESSEVVVMGLTVNYLAEPRGIDDRTPALGWRLRSAGRAVVQSAYQVRAASTPQLLALDTPDLWDSGTIASGRQVDVGYGGRPLSSREQVFWQVRVWTGGDNASAWSPVARWEMGLLEPSDWTAEWITGAAPLNGGPLPIFARRFTVPPESRIEQARLYVSGLGLYEPRLNGRKVGADVLVPSVTDYRKRALYKTYDVAEHLRTGDNVVGLLVGSGFFDVPEREGRYWESVTWKNGFAGGGETIRLSGEPKVVAQLEIRYDNGTVQQVCSDTTWRVDDGPLDFSGYYGGEDYDARRWQSGWDGPDGDHSEWRSAVVAADFPAVLSAQFEPAVVEAERLPAVEMTEPEPGTYVFDFGTSFVGWPQIEVEGPAGTRIALFPGWYLDNGRVSQNGMVGWVPNVVVADHYTLAGGGVESWHPRFSYHGFRYLEIRGLPTPPHLSSVTGIAVRAAAGTTAEFDCSNPLLNAMDRIADRSMRSAMIAPTMPTDPNREKAGWQADRGMALSGVHRYDFAAYNQALLRDVFDAQRADGNLSGIVPDPTDFWYVGDINWSGAPIVQAEENYRRYGDTASLRRHYPGMRQYFRLLRSREQDGLYPGGDITEGYFGDWMYPGQHWQHPFDPDNAHFTPPEITVAWGYWKIATAMAGIARALGHLDDALEYRGKAEAIATTYHRRFFDPATTTYLRGAQTATALALEIGAPPPELRTQVLATLVESIRESGNHLNTGMIGLPAIVRVLIDAGRHDVLHDVALQTSYPSYGYWLERGATALPESWDWNGREGVADLNILGGLTSWFIHGLGGIHQDLDAVAFDKIRIAPAIVGSLTTVNATVRTVRGEIVSRWHRDGTAVTLEVVVPANSTATVVVPLLQEDAEITASDETRLIDRDEKSATYRTGSGAWTFAQK